MLDPTVCILFVRSLFCYAVRYALSSVAIISLRKRKRAGCFTVIVLWCQEAITVPVFLSRVLWIGLQCVIVAFLRHTH